MRLWLRRIIPLAVLVVCGATAMSALAGTARRGPLTGTWSGTIAASGIAAKHIVIVVNARETGGTWSISATCRGALTLDSISNGYHHYLRHLAAGSTCAGGDIDCLKRAGANLYDAVTSHLGGDWDVTGTLRRVGAAG